MRTLKQVATNMADAFTRFGLWKGGGSSVSNYLTYDLNKIITTIGASKIQEYTAENDCFIFVPILANNGTSNIYIDNIIIANLYNDSGNVTVSFPAIFLERGKTIRVERVGNESWMWHDLTVYGIKEIESNLHEYSTEEKVVGKWIDGKPIYEKVISGTIIGSPSDWIDFYDCTELNIDTMIEIKGFFNYRNQRSFILNDRYTAFTYKYDTKIIQNYNTDLGGGLTFNVTAIIQYTKI